MLSSLLSTKKSRRITETSCILLLLGYIFFPNVAISVVLYVLILTPSWIASYLLFRSISVDHSLALFS